MISVDDYRTMSEWDRAKLKGLECRNDTIRYLWNCIERHNRKDDGEG